MKRDRLSIHISDSAEITVEERRNGIKRIKNISINDLLVCIQSSLREIKPVYHAVLPKNALFYSCCPETGNFSAAIEYPYSKATVTYMATEYPDFPLPRLVFGFKIGGNAVTLYSSFNPKGVHLKNYESYNALLNEPSVGRHDVPVEPEKSKIQIREITERNKIYTGLLKLLRLEKEHFTNLLNRGLDSERIARNMYRSFPTDNAERQWICDSLAARYDLHGMPGFYRTDGIWHIAAFKSGILIPIRDRQNLIQGLQIRFDNPPVKRVTTPEGITIEKTGTRFMWLSSSKQKKFEGTSVPSYIHITGNRDSDTVYLTEGGLKADAASYLSGDKLFIGLTGVQNTGFLKEVISLLGPKKIVECVDMDVRSNPQVQKAQVKIQAICAPLCETYKRLFWPIDQKGIDDLRATCSTTILIVRFALLNKMWQ